MCELEAQAFSNQGLERKGLLQGLQGRSAGFSTPVMVSARCAAPGLLCCARLQLTWLTRCPTSAVPLNLPAFIPFIVQHFRICGRVLTFLGQ